MRRQALRVLALLMALGTSAVAQQPPPPPEPEAPAAPAEPAPEREAPAEPCPAAPVADLTPPPPKPPPPGTARAYTKAYRETVETKIEGLQQRLERVPDNPAVDLIGADDLQITKPGSVKDLGVELRGLYADGKIVPQVAIEVSPFALTLGRSSGIDDYRKNSYIRILHRITMSLATTATGEGDSEAVLGSVGLRLRLVDGTDWRLNEEAITCALTDVPTPPPAGAPEPHGTITLGSVEADQELAKAQQKANDCFKKNVKWNATQWAVGAAVSSAFPQGELRSDIHELAAWTSATFGLRSFAQLVVGGKYLFSDVHLEEEMRVPARHTASATAELELRAKKQHGLILTAGAGLRWSDEMTGWRRDEVGLFGAEVQLGIGGDKVLALRISGELSTDAKGGIVSLANFKWNYDILKGK